MRAASSGTTDEQLARKLKAPQKSQTTAAQPHSSRLPGSIGVVKTLNGDGTATVTFNGADIPCQLLGDFYPTLGQSVLVLVEGTRNWAIGPVATSPSGWQSIADTLGYESGWSDTESGYAPGAYRMLGDIVTLRGLVTGPSSGTSTIFQLPAGYQPKGIEAFSTIVAAGNAQIGVRSDGTVFPGISADASGGISLSGVSFSVS